MKGFLTTVRLLYQLTAILGAVGFVSYLLVQGLGPALGFAFGAACSAGNLWLFDWLTRTLAPGESKRKPWKPAIFVLRYFVLLASGYAIVKLLGVNALTVIWGLLTSTAAVLLALIAELFQSLFRRASSH
jgi:hypothetical protein